MPLSLLEKVRAVLRAKDYSVKTEECYLHWIKDFIVFHQKRHPQTLSGEEIEAYFVHLSEEKNVKNKQIQQAYSAVVFLYTHVVKPKEGKLDIQFEDPRHKPLFNLPPVLKGVLRHIKRFQFVYILLLVAAVLLW